MLRRRAASEADRQRFTKCDSVGPRNRWIIEGNQLNEIRNAITARVGGTGGEHRGERIICEELMPLLHPDHQATTRIMRDTLSEL